MSRYPHKNLPLKTAKFDGKKFEEKKPARIGSKRAPLSLVVTSEKKRAEVEEICKDNRWYYQIEVSTEDEEDISEMTFLLDKKSIAKSTRIAGRNDPCPCDSGKKYKQCCGK